MKAFGVTDNTNLAPLMMLRTDGKRSKFNTHQKRENKMKQFVGVTDYTN